MLAIIFDKNENKYYISEIYGIVNCGVDKYIVDKLQDGRKLLTSVQAIDFSTPFPHVDLVERISANTLPFPWIYIPSAKMKHFNALLQTGEDYHNFSGYKFIWDQQQQLAELIQKGTVLKESLVREQITTKLDGWNYIETQADIDALMNQFGGFHDSVIREIHYISGDYKLEDGSMQFAQACQKKIQMIFDSDWSDSIELVFEAPRVLQLVPPGENYLADLYDASIFIKDCMVYFYDSYMESIPDTYEGTFIKAMGMRWRLLQVE